jgi:hypothetical protein
MSIWHWIVVAVLLAFVFLLVRRAWKDSAAPDSLTAVRGWLALLVVGLTFIGPLMGAGRLNSSFIEAEGQFPQLATIAPWSTYKAAAWISFVVGAGVSMYAGGVLGFTCRRSAVRIGIVALWVAGPVLSTVLAVVLPGAIFGSADLGADQVGSLIGSGIIASGWTAYLLRSKRVQARYVEDTRAVPVAAPGAIS